MINRHIFLLALTMLCGCGRTPPTVPPGPCPRRIVSFAPNITEIVCALGLESNLTGVTTFCTWPEAAQKIPKVGGFGCVNYEAVVALRPDLVILHPEFESDQQRLDSLGIPWIAAGSSTIADILSAIRSIGQACGAEQQADQLIADLERRTAAIVAQSAAQAVRPKVLVTFGRQRSDEAIDRIFAIGPDCIHGEMVALAGGQNVIVQPVPFATLSREAVLRLDPDVIIELAPELDGGGTALKSWAAFGSVTAVRNGRVSILTGGYTCIPGPRFIRTLENFARAIGGAL